MEWLGQLINSVAKIAPAPLLAVGIATGIVLFVPDSVAATLGIDSFRSANHGLIGAGFIFSWSYLAVHFLMWLKNLGANGWTRRKGRLAREKQFHSLTPEEQGYLAPYVQENINTQEFPVEDGVIGGLLAKGIVYRSSNVFDMAEGVPYNLQPWAKTYLTEHPELLADAVRQVRRDDRI